MEKAESLVIHTGTNGIQQKISTIKIVKKLVKVIKEKDSEKKKTEIIFSGLIQREDHDFRNQTEEINGKLKRYCESKRYNRFVGNSNIDGVFLNRSKIKRVRLYLVGILPMFSNTFDMHLIVMMSL